MQRTERDQRAPVRRFTYSRRGYDVTEVDRFVAEIEPLLEATAQRVQLLEGQLDQLSHENAALTQMINHVARLGEQMVADARKEANDIVAEARAGARARPVVDGADARSHVADERRKVADELEMLAIVRETVVAERETLLTFHTELNNRLRETFASIVRYRNGGAVDELAAAAGITSRETDDVRDDDCPGESDGVVPPTGIETQTEPTPTEWSEAAPLARDAQADDHGRHDPFADEHFDRAFSSFMGNEADVEPSRHWMISEE